VILHLFDSCGKIRAQCLHPVAHLGFYLTITVEVFSVKVLHWSDDVEVCRHKVGMYGDGQEISNGTASAVAL
jgi:hypothetical protein